MKYQIENIKTKIYKIQKTTERKKITKKNTQYNKKRNNTTKNTTTYTKYNNILIYRKIFTLFEL